MARFGDIAGPAGIATIFAGPIGSAIMLTWMAVFPDVGSASFTPLARVVAVPFTVLMLLPFSLPFGVIVGVVPSFLGTTLLAFAGDRSRVMRHPVVWAATGAALGAIVARVIAVELTYPKHGLVWAEATGALCMLVSRSIIRWRG